MFETFQVVTSYRRSYPVFHVISFSMGCRLNDKQRAKEKYEKQHLHLIFVSQYQQQWLVHNRSMVMSLTEAKTVNENLSRKHEIRKTKNSHIYLHFLEVILSLLSDAPLGITEIQKDVCNCIPHFLLIHHRTFFHKSIRIRSEYQEDTGKKGDRTPSIALDYCNDTTELQRTHNLIDYRPYRQSIEILNHLTAPHSIFNGVQSSRQ